MKLKSVLNIEVLLVSLITFLVNPLIGVLLMFNLFYSKLKFSKEKFINLFIVFLALLIAFINATKIPMNDLHFHATQYLLVKNLSLFEYLKYIEKEPMGYTFNYVMYHITNGSIKFWVLTFSFISYMLFFSALKKFYIKIQAPTHLLVLSLIMASFFPQLFSLSAHLIRQFIASSIFIYFAVDKIFYKNNKWWLVLIGILTHGSSLLLYALVYFKFLGNFKKYRVLNFILIFTLLFYQYIAKLLLGIVGGISQTVTYILERASRDTTFNLGDFQVMNFIMMVTMIYIALSSKNIIRSMQKEKNKTLEKKVKFFFLTMIMLSFFILINLKQSELSNRLFFYLFFYFPFVIPLFIMKFKQRTLLSYFTSILFMVYFTYRLEFGIWIYASLNDLGTNSFFDFLNYPEPDLESRKYYW